MSLNETHSTTQTTIDSILIVKYQSAVEEGNLVADPHQEHVLSELQQVYNQLIVDSSSLQQSSFASLFIRPKIVKRSHAGLYIWGGVGRGKTYLVDLFYEQVPIKKKLRLHFHRFMQLVHEELKLLEGVEDPLKQVASNLANKARLLCLDEIHVIDITDAMLLGRLFQYLFKEGVVLVTTSNFHPDDLYKNGLQRERFLPAIRRIKEHTKVIEMDGELDYRSKAMDEISLYYLPSNNESDKILEEHFHRLSGVELHRDRNDVIINTRKILVNMWSAEVVWFNFDDLCNTARSTEDYTQIATFFRTVLISNIPVMDDSMDDAARRFINMIDTFYDMRINLIVSADSKPEELYTAKKLVFEFQRTASRIKEMQSKKYILNK
ncbi:MAG: cell division protein ZapE [Cocleimonas sp.]